MKTKRSSRLLSILLSLVMVVGIMPITAYATEPETEMVFEKGWHSGPGYMEEYVFVANDSANEQYYAMSSEAIKYQNEDGLDSAGYKNPNDEIILNSIEQTALAAEAVDGENDIISFPKTNNKIAVMTAEKEPEGYYVPCYTYNFLLGTKTLVARIYHHTYYYMYDDDISYHPYTSMLPSLSFYESDNVPVDTVSWDANGYHDSTTQFDTANGTSEGYTTSTTGNELSADYYPSVIQLLSTNNGLAFNFYMKNCDPSTQVALASVYTRVCQHENMVEHPAVAATNTSDGTKLYYSCPDCGGYYSDAAATDEISMYDIPPIAHYLERIDAKAATCTENGVTETYYKCANCNETYRDAAGTDQIWNEHSMIIPAAGHSDADGDLICDICHQSITPLEFKKVTLPYEITAGGTYILVDANGNIMGKPVIDPENGIYNVNSISSVNVTPNDKNNYSYYDCKAAGAMIFDLDHIYEYQKWGTDVSMVYGMHYDGLCLTCYEGSFSSENAEWAKYGMEMVLNNDAEKSVNIASHYDNAWELENAKNIFFRSYTDDKENTTSFAMKPDMGGTENKVYLYRMVGCYNVSENLVLVADQKSATNFSDVDSAINTPAANGGTNVTGISAAIPDEAITSSVSEIIDEYKITPDTGVTVDTRVDVTATEYTEGESITFSLDPILGFATTSLTGTVPILDGDFDGVSPMTVTIFTGGITPTQIVHIKQDGTNEYFYHEYSDEVLKNGKKAFKVLNDSVGNQYVQFELTEFSNVQILSTALPEIKEPCDHEDKDNDYVCDKCGEKLIAVSASSRMDIAGDVTVADITVSKEKLASGEEVTITTKSLDGYTFAGWYIEKDKVCDTLSYTFNPTETVALVAEYQAKGDATLTVGNGSFTINGGSEKTNYDAVAHRIGTKITVSATSDGFQNWKNENGKIVSTASTYTFTMTGNTTLRMSISGIVDESDSSNNTALVEFVSDFNQVISALTCDATESITFPYGPSKVGHIFIGWSINGVYSNDTQTLEDIRAKIGLGETHIIVKPVYQKEAVTFGVTVYTDGVKNTELSKDALYAGDTFTVSAPTVDGKEFKCWALDNAGENVLSTDNTYFMQVSKAVSLYAIYVTSGEEIVKVPVVAITNIFATDTNGVHKVSFAATRSVPTGYTLIEQGMLYGRSNDFAVAPTTEEFIIDGHSVHKFASSDKLAAGVFTMNIKVTGIESETIYARAYMLVKDNLTGNTLVVYSTIESGVYSTLLA